MNRPCSSNIVWSNSAVRREQREALLGQRGCVVWFTGLSGSGKSTIARAVEQQLVADGRFAYVLDGDNVRHGLCGDLGFSDADRQENIRRIGEVAAIFADAGAIALAAFISPFRADRALARRLCGNHAFIEVHVATSLQACEQRDVKGLYAKARAGDIHNFTGIDSPYEAPEQPELTIDTTQCNVETAARMVSTFITDNGIVSFLRENDGSGI